MCVNTAVVAMTFSNTMKLVQQDKTSHNNPGTDDPSIHNKLANSRITQVTIKQLDEMKYLGFS